MKIKGEVVAADFQGANAISIRLLGTVAAPGLYGSASFSLTLANTPRNRNTFRLGREVELTVKPK